MKKTQKLFLCLAVAGALLPMTANAENTGVSVQETAAISENKAPEAELVANQMKNYYLGETEPQGSTFYRNKAGVRSLVLRPLSHRDEDRQAANHVQ